MVIILATIYVAIIVPYNAAFYGASRASEDSSVECWAGGESKVYNLSSRLCSDNTISDQSHYWALGPRSWALIINLNRRYKEEHYRDPRQE